MMPGSTDEALSRWLDGPVGHWDLGGWMVQVIRPASFIVLAYKTANREAVDLDQLVRGGQRLGDFERIMGERPMGIESLLSPTTI